MHTFMGDVFCRVSPCLALSYLVSSRLVSSRLVSSRLVSCRVVSCRVLPCRVVSCGTVSCRVVPCRAVSHNSYTRCLDATLLSPFSCGTVQTANVDCLWVPSNYDTDNSSEHFWEEWKLFVQGERSFRMHLLAPVLLFKGTAIRVGNRVPGFVRDIL
jgi:hypothetical protein